MKQCSVEGCNRPIEAKGLCNTHYERLRKKGYLDPAPIKKKIINCSYKKPGKLSLAPNGYIVVCIGKSNMYYHRWLMEQFLGRKLKKQEIVHHIDKNRLNNKLNNLKVIVNQAIHMHLNHKKQSLICIAPGCNKPAKECSLCTGHYKRLYRHGNVFANIPLGKAQQGRISYLNAK